MTDAILEHEKEYVTAQAFQEALDDLKRSITELGERIALSDKKADDARQVVEDRVRQERDAREADIATLKQEVSESLKQNEVKLGRIDNKIDVMSQTLSTSIAELTGTIKNWSSVMDSRDQAYKDNRERIQQNETKLEAFGRDIDLVTSNQASLTQTLGEVRKTIYGVAGEQPPSLFSMIAEMQTQISKGFEKQQIQLSTALEVSRQNSQAIEAIQQAQLEEKARWQKRKDDAKEFAKAVLNNKRFWAIAGTVTVGTVLGLFPEAREAILDVMKLLLAGE